MIGGTHEDGGRFASNLVIRDFNFIALSGIDSQLLFRLEHECPHMLCAVRDNLDMP